MSQQQPTTIPPNAFDLLPDLHALLQRVYTDDLDPASVSHESNFLRLKIAKARQLVASLPEVDKTLSQQQEEIAKLEERIARQREMLMAVAEMAVVKEATERVGAISTDG